MPAPIIRDPLLLQLYSYWKERREGTRPPERSSIDPVDMPRAVLPYLMLAEFEGPDDELPRVRYRLVGTAIGERYGGDFTGHYLDDVAAPHYCALLRQLYGQMRDAARPIYVESVFSIGDMPAVDTRRIYLPIARHGRVDMVLAAQRFPLYTLADQTFFKILDGLPYRVAHRSWLLDPETSEAQPLAA